MPNSSSCFSKMLSVYVDLTDEEHEGIARLEKTERTIGRDEMVFTEGDVAEELYIVKSGWLCSFRNLEDGQRQVVQLHHPGDMCGYHELMLRQRTSSMVALVDSVLCPLPKSALTKLGRETPRIALLIEAIVSRELVAIVDTLQAIARSQALERVLHLLLFLYHRLAVINPLVVTTGNFRLPMTQSLIGDMLGLTNVSVSVAMKELERMGFITRERRTVTFIELEKAKERVDFKDRFQDADLSFIDTA